MIVKLIRIVCSLLVISGLYWWGEKYGPRSAMADVYRIQKTDSYNPLVPLKTESHSMGSRNILLNDSQSNVTLSYSDESISSIIKQLEAFSQKNRVQDVTVNNFDQLLIQSLTRPYRVMGKSSAMFIHLIQDIQPGMGTEVFKRLANKEPFGDYAKLGYSIVLNRAENGKTAIWKTEFKSDNDFFKFLENNMKEASGNDILGIEGFPGSRRIVSFAESTQIGQSYVTVYEGKGSIHGHIQFFKAHLYQLGLKERPIPDWSKRAMLSKRESLYFYKENYEVTIFISQSENKQYEIMDVIELSVKS